MSKRKRPNCYECIHRRDLPGNAHSRCVHPSNAEINDNPMMNIMAILGGVSRIPAFTMEGGELGVKGNEHGIRRGWFIWPMNFDPVWLEACNGFTKKETQAEAD